MKKILYISGTRADYGLMRHTLFAIKKHPRLSVEIAVCGMHLMKGFGKTINEIKKDGFKISQINVIYSARNKVLPKAGSYKNDDKQAMARFVGKCILGLLDKIKLIKPDIVLVLGDRAEALAGAIVGAYLTVPVCHIHGGDVSSTIDEINRHTITKLAHIHFPATKKSAERIIKMGENKKQVYLVGAPGLDDIAGKKLNPTKNKPILLVLQHPISLEIENAAKQIRETLEATKEIAKDIDGQVVIIYPNADAGARKMIKIIEQYRKYPFVQIHKSLPRDLYLSVMKNADVLIGNSSSGIIEAPCLKTAVVNIGSRQDGREKADNVINVGYDKKAIKKAIKKAMSKEFMVKLKKVINPYGNGKAGQKIVKILANLEINNKLLDKKLNL